MYEFRNRKGGHFHNFTHYERFADYDTNSVSYYDYLAKINKYLHYIDHLLGELQDILNDILERLTDLEDKVNVLEMYMHVPAKLDLLNDTMHLLQVSNVNRTHADGLSEKLEDINEQLHLIDVSNLELEFENIWKEIEKIWKEIKEIWNYLDNLANPEYKTISPSNYDVAFRNGFSGSVVISYLDLGSYYTLKITTSSSDKLKNSNLKNTKLRHNLSLRECPQSVIFQIKFKNEFAFLNDKSYLNGSGGSDVWNIDANSSQPLSWAVSCGINSKYNNFSDSSWNNYTLTLSCITIADGYNTQYSLAKWYEGISPLYGEWLNTDSYINVKIK